MWAYAAVFLACLAVDSVPVFAPPAWTVILAFVVGERLDPWPAAACGAAGSTIGRYLLSRFMPRLARRYLNEKGNENLRFLGGRLDASYPKAFGFVLLYAMTPLSTTALFTAAGAARIDFLPVLPAFFLGKFAADALLVLAGRRTFRTVRDIVEGQASPQAVAMTLLGLAAVALVLFIDWRELLRRRRLRLEFRVWRRS